jgi:RHS repeat-associated protein
VLDAHALTHDEDGNQTTRSTPDGDWTYAWNGHGLLTAIKRPDGARVEFDYDAFARRVGRRRFSSSGAPVRDTTFVWDGHVPIHEIDSVTGLTTWYWLPDTATPIVKDHAGRRSVIASDLIGTPTHLYDESGRPSWRARIDLFGRVQVELGDPADCPWRWPGQYDDGFQDELYNRCRYYSPTRGSYISRDPAGLEAGAHRYAYVPDPLVWFDLLGLTGTYLFSLDDGMMYIGKGPVTRARTSQRQRAGALDITKGAHMDFGDSRMGLMVEAELMTRYGFGDNGSLLNAVNSPGKKLLEAATSARRGAVEKYADTLDKAYQTSQGKIC